MTQIATRRALLPLFLLLILTPSATATGGLGFIIQIPAPPAPLLNVCDLPGGRALCDAVATANQILGPAKAFLVGIGKLSATGVLIALELVTNPVGFILSVIALVIGKAFILAGGVVTYVLTLPANAATFAYGTIKTAFDAVGSTLAKAGAAVAGSVVSSYSTLNSYVVQATSTEGYGPLAPIITLGLWLLLIGSAVAVAAFIVRVLKRAVTRGML